VTEGGKRLALGWMTRIDREKVAAALQLFYRKEVAYPQVLQQVNSHPKVPAEARPPMTDRLGKPWVYKLVGFKTIPNTLNQKYSLQSTALGELSDLKAAVKAPYGSSIQATPVQVVPAPGNSVAVKFNLGATGGSAVIGQGASSGNLYLAFAGAQIVVVCDYTYWKVFPKP
jgi:hypothetical protein